MASVLEMLTHSISVTSSLPICSFFTAASARLKVCVAPSGSMIRLVPGLILLFLLNATIQLGNLSI